MDTDGARRLNRSSPSCLNSGAQRTDFFHGLLADLGNEDFYIFPTPPPQGAACFNDTSDFSPKLLWKLFRQVVEHEPQSIRPHFGKS